LLSEQLKTSFQKAALALAQASFQMPKVIKTLKQNADFSEDEQENK
jgi:hypothetical protein